jgi:hypothetical protein
LTEIEVMPAGTVQRWVPGELNVSVVAWLLATASGTLATTIQETASFFIRQENMFHLVGREAHSSFNPYRA